MRLVMYTLWGLYQTYPEILDNIELPEEMDKTTMLDYIFMYAGENEVRYPHPAVLERLVNRWFSSRKHDFEKMWRALHAEYNPIENTDRYEDSWRTIERDGEGTEKRDSSNTVERTNSQTAEVNGESTGNGTTTGESTRTSNLTTEETVSAFDSESYQPGKQRSESGTESTNNTETTNTSANSSQSSEQNGNENESATGNTNINRTEKSKDMEKTGLHSHGNIGITTNQEMITEELELRKFDIYKSIALVFEDEFTIPVYERRCNEYGLL